MTNDDALALAREALPFGARQCLAENPDDSCYCQGCKNVRAVAAAIEQAVREAQLCDVCVGKPLASGRDCACGGTGNIFATAIHLRERLFDDDNEIARLRAVAAVARKMVDAADRRGETMGTAAGFKAGPLEKRLRAALAALEATDAG